MGYRFEIFKDNAGDYRFRFVAPNGEIMFQSQNYTEKQSAKGTIDSLKKHLADASIFQSRNEPEGEVF